MAKKIHADEIDENFIIASIKQERKPEPEITPALAVESIPKVKVVEPSPEPKASKKARGKLEQYEELFFTESLESARLGKGITIRPEFHENIMEILHLLGDTQVTLFSYVDNILAHHFETYEAELDEFYKERYKKPKFASRK